MHKKLFTAVLALGLLLFANGSVTARDSAPPDGFERPLTTTYGNGQSKAALTPTAELAADPLVTVNGGQNRTVPGTFCNGNWYAPFGFTVGGWYAGDEFYAAYQNPQDANYWNGTCTNSPSFDVTAINAIVRFSAGPFPATFAFQPLVFDVVTGCNYDGISNQPAPVAGGALCAGPLYAVTWTAGASFIINLPFAVECCISDDYYAAYYAPTAGALRLGCTDGSMDQDVNTAFSGTECLIFNDYGLGWDELTGNYFCCFNLTGVVPWGGPANSLEHMIWSEGYTPDDLATHCNPGQCEYAFAYTTNDSLFVRYEDGNDDWNTGFIASSTPAPTGASRFGVRFDAIGLDTLKEFKFLVHEFFTGTPGADELIVEIWDQGPATGCNGEKVPGALLYSVVIDSLSIQYYPNINTIVLPDITFGTLNGGPERSIFATIRATYGLTGTAMGRPVTAPGTTGCLTPPFRSHSLLYYANWGGLGSPEWKYVGDRNVVPNASGHFEFVMEGRICREVLPAQEADCGVGGPDQWSSFAHDNRQTSASNINIGDPNEVTREWHTQFATTSDFTNPTVHNGIIYQSSGNRLNAVDLATGTLLGIVTGGPELSSSGNRSNATVANITALGIDVVFTGGGTFPSYSAWDADLETGSPSPIWQASPGIGSTVPGGLGQQTRFGAAKVATIGPDQVLFLVTEPPTGSGRLYALDAATGALYPGWATNPLVLDVAAKHGPAIDGGKLYVGTAIGGSNVAGSLYQVDAATGVVDWNFVGVVGEGWPSGVSVEGDFLYGATRDADLIGRRYKIDKSGAMPSVVWTAAQGIGLYGTPTVGRDFVYFPLDNPSFGLLQVDKVVGTVARNFGVSDICGNTLFMVPQIATLSCDSYIFAGDRNGRWWLFNAVDGTAEWYRQFPFITGGEIVNGTALASFGGVNYAVVSVRDANAAGGLLSAYRLNAGPRPRLVQCITDETVIVPLGAGAGNPHSVAGDVFVNVGSQPLNFTALNITDPLPDGLAASTRNYRNNLVNVAREFDGYTMIASSDNLTKKQLLSGLGNVNEDGFTSKQLSMIETNTTSRQGRSSVTRGMAAGASAIRTSAVLVGGASVPTSLAPGAAAGLDWIYDGTGLGRGQDANDLEFDMNDPDFNYDGSPVATFHILYVGGCLPTSDTLHFGAANREVVYNDGALGDDGKDDDFFFAPDGTGPGADLYDMGLMLLGDSVAGPGTEPDYGAQAFMNIYTQVNNYVPNVAPVSGACGFDVLRNVALGTKRTGGCPGTPVDIFGEIITHSMSDTDFAAAPGTPGAAIGTDIIQTEVGAYDPLYGDFKLIQWLVVNRDGVAKGPLYLGTQADWDINGGTNFGLISDNFNGYALYGGSANTIAYGALDPNQRSLYAGVDPSGNSPHKIWSLSNPTRVYSNTFDWGDEVKKQAAWSEYVNGASRLVDPGQPEDVSGALLNAPINLAPNGSAAVHHAIFGVDGSSGNAAIIEANAVELAKRAARWAGFARGDVNDDGVVDLADVCWLQGGNHIYPAAYSGDVDNNGVVDGADEARLLSFVSGNLADQPEGAWRF